MYLGLWGFWSFYSSIKLTFVSWRGRSFLVGKIIINTHILLDPFLVRTLLIRVNRVVQDFFFIDIREGQARPRWTRHRLLHSRRPLDPFEVPRCLVQRSSGIKVRSLAYGIVALVPPFSCVEPTSSLEPSTSSYVNKFTSFWEHPYHPHFLGCS